MSRDISTPFCFPWFSCGYIIHYQTHRNLPVLRHLPINFLLGPVRNSTCMTMYNISKMPRSSLNLFAVRLKLKSFLCLQYECICVINQPIFFRVSSLELGQFDNLITNFKCNKRLLFLSILIENILVKLGSQYAPFLKVVMILFISI